MGYNEGNLSNKNLKKENLEMNDLGHDVVDAGLETLAGPTCPIRTALPKLAVFAAVTGGVFLVWKLVKKAKAKKLAPQPDSNGNPGETE